MLRKPGVLSTALVIAAAFALSGPVAAQSQPHRTPSAQAAKTQQAAPPARRSVLESIRARFMPARPDTRRPALRCRG